MRIVITPMAIIAVVLACKTQSSTDQSARQCFPIIDKGVSSLQKFGLQPDTSYLDSALSYYDDAIRCDSVGVNPGADNIEALADVGRYRESLTIIDNVFKVRDVPTSRDAHFMMIKAWLYDKIGEKDSSRFYVEMIQRITTPE
jgi:hypothetical protein